MSTAKQWYYSDGREQYGPITVADLRLFIEMGTITQAHLVWRDGWRDWLKVEDAISKGKIELRPTLAPKTTRQQSKQPLPRKERKRKEPLNKIALPEKKKWSRGPKEATNEHDHSLDRMLVRGSIATVVITLTVLAAIHFRWEGSISSFLSSLAEDADTLAVATRQLLSPLATLFRTTVSLFVCMIVCWGPFWAYLAYDIRLRKERKVWFIGCVVTLLVFPFYFARRKLMQGESRDGGQVWNVIRGLVIAITYNIAILMVIAWMFPSLLLTPPISHYALGLQWFGQIGFLDMLIASQNERVIVVRTIGSAWLSTMCVLAIIGYFFRDPNRIECGPDDSVSDSARGGKRGKRKPVGV